MPSTVLLLAALLAAPATPASPSPPPTRAPDFNPYSSDSYGADDAPKLAPAAQLTWDSLDFSAQLYNQLAKVPGNLVFAPGNIARAMGLLHAGAKGTTLAGIRQAMHWTGADADIPIGLQDIELELTQTDMFRLGVGQLGSLPLVLPDLMRADLLPNPAAMRTWLGTKTHPDLAGEPALAQASDGLLSTTAFISKWGTPRQKGQTKRNYKTRNGQLINMRTVNATAQLQYAETPAYQLVELRYATSHLSLVILLPRSNAVGLQTAPSGAALREMLAQLAPARVKVSLPVFALSATYDLRGILGAMGLEPALGAWADFSVWPEVKRGSLSVRGVVHRASIAVDEQSTVVDAFTLVQLRGAAPQLGTSKPGKLLDKPFLFLLRDTNWGMPLLFGRVEATN